MQVVGVDGWRRGWIAVRLSAGSFVEATTAEKFGDVVAPGDVIVAVDIPVGLPATGRRRADTMARAMVRGRGSTIFPTPPRDVVETIEYSAANHLAKTRHGFGISKQSFMLQPKIREVDAYCDGPQQVFEVHPEVAFAAVHGEVLPPKKTYAGVTARLEILRRSGVELPDDLGPAGAAPIDDVLDAAVVALVAHRIGLGQGRSLPDPPESDERGRPMAIWY